MIMKTSNLKTILFTIMLSAFSLLLNAQDCIYYTNLDSSKFSSTATGYNNDTNYPAGSTLFTNGDLKFIKHGKYSSGFGQFDYTLMQFYNAGSGCGIIGTIGFDVSSATYSCKKLTINSFGHFAAIIDSDTIFTNNKDSVWIMNGYTFTTSQNSSITEVKGSFNYVALGTSTAIFNSACLENCSSGSSSCIDSTMVLAGNYSSNTIITTSGDLSIFAPDTSTQDFKGCNIMGNPNNAKMILGGLGFDVGASSYSCKKLDIYYMFGANGFPKDGIYVDGVNLGLNPASPYNGNGFTLTKISNNHYEIKGNFNKIWFNGATSFFYNICLSDCSGKPGCINFMDMDPAKVTTQTGGYNNDSSYPAGSTLVSSGDLKLIKTKTFAQGIFQGSQVGGVTDSTMMFHGTFDIDFSSSNYSCKKITLKVIGQDIIIGSDTLTQTPGSYNGNGYSYNVTTSQGYSLFIISGSINSIRLYSATGIIREICLEDCSASSNSPCIIYSDLDSTKFSSSATGYNDDNVYPAGSTIYSSGDLKLIKHGKFSGGFGQFDYTLMQFYNTNGGAGIIGTIGFDVSSATYSCKKLTINSFGHFAAIIDTDTIFTNNRDSVWTMNGYTFTTSQNSSIIEVKGSFNYVALGTSTAIFNSACLEECTTNYSCLCDSSKSYASFTYKSGGYNVINFNNTSVTQYPVVSQTWSFGDGQNGVGNSPVHTYLKPGKYEVCLTIVDSLNCTWHYCDSVTVTCSSNQNVIITPNNDGIEDGTFVSDKAKVYDRNGYLVRTISVPENWKGKDDNNNDLPMGQYVVILENGVVLNVTIIR